MKRSRIGRRDADRITTAHLARLDALEPELVAEAHARKGAGSTAGLTEWLEERLARERARFERELDEVALPASLAEMDS